MSTDRLHLAADKIREVAYDAPTNVPWHVRHNGEEHEIIDAADDLIAFAPFHGDASHIALWTPRVALLVADLLDEVGRELEAYPDLALGMNTYFDIADAILGDTE